MEMTESQKRAADLGLEASNNRAHQQEKLSQQLHHSLQRQQQRKEQNVAHAVAAGRTTPPPQTIEFAARTERSVAQARAQAQTKKRAIAR